MTGVIASVAPSAALMQTRLGHALLKGVGLFQAPVIYAELAFSTPDGLPGDLASKRTSVGAITEALWSLPAERNGCVARTVPIRIVGFSSAVGTLPLTGSLG